MDVDNNTNTESQGGGIDIEQSLLQQFSCLGTTDREDLVKQLQKLLGSSIDSDAAAFYLDMNNWNLQAAICSYFDIDAPTPLPNMTLIRDYHKPGVDGAVAADSGFVKYWEVRNSGKHVWPACFLKFISGEEFEAAGGVSVCRLKPGETHLISVVMRSPSEPGVYQSTWRMVTDNGVYFGDPIVSTITVVDNDSLQLSQQLRTNFLDLGRSPPGPVVVNNPFSPQRTSSQNMFSDTDQSSSSTPNGPDPDMNMC